MCFKFVNVILWFSLLTHAEPKKNFSKTVNEAESEMQSSGNIALFHAWFSKSFALQDSQQNNLLSHSFGY